MDNLINYLLPNILQMKFLLHYRFCETAMRDQKEISWIKHIESLSMPEKKREGEILKITVGKKIILIL